jgi:hypothetical protein
MGIIVPFPARPAVRPHRPEPDPEFHPLVSLSIITIGAAGCWLIVVKLAESLL